MLILHRLVCHRWLHTAVIHPLTYRKMSILGSSAKKLQRHLMPFLPAMSACFYKIKETRQYMTTVYSLRWSSIGVKNFLCLTGTHDTESQVKLWSVSMLTSNHWNSSHLKIFKIIYKIFDIFILISELSCVFYWSSRH